MTEEQKYHLAKAIDAAVRLDQQLNILLDHYDFYTQRYEGLNEKQKFMLVDLQHSIRALGTLPRQLGLTLLAWRSGADPVLSKQGFEVNVLNELAIHMYAISEFFKRQHIDIEPFSSAEVISAIADIVRANQVFSPSKTI